MTDVSVLTMATLWPSCAGTQAAARKAARAVSLSKVPPHQVELTKMQNTFVLMLKEMKRDAASNLEPAKTATKEVVSKMLAELTQGQDAPLAVITPEQITDAIIHTVDGAELDPEKLAEFRGGLTALARELYFSILEQADSLVYVSGHIARIVCSGATDTLTISRQIKEFMIKWAKMVLGE